MKRNIIARVHFIIFFVIATISAYADPREDFDKYFKITPIPQKVTISTGRGILGNDIKAIHLDGFQKLLALDGILGGLPLSDQGGNGIVTLRLSQSSNLPSSPEGYILEISNGRIVVSARSEAGLFYGCQTLQQLLTDSRDQNRIIPGCRIEDYPDIAYRGVLVVLAHHLSTGKYYYDLMDRLAAIKVNAVIIQFEDKLRFIESPLVGAANSISIEEFAAICRYAKDRFIEISPLVQGLGHAGYILKHDQYKHLRENPESDLDFSPLDSGTYKVLFSLYKDAMDATPFGKYLHVGGDEVENIGTSELSKKSGKKPFELQMYWLNRVSEFAKLHNRIPIFWDDMLFKLAGEGMFETMMHDISIPEEKIRAVWNEHEGKLDNYITLFPKNCIYMRWNYRHAEVLGNIKAIDWYKAHDLKVMGATAATSHPEILLPRNNSNVSAIKTYSQIAGEKKIEGILCTVWDDRSPHFETIWRGIYGFALFSWNNKEQTLARSNSIFRHRFYAPELSDSANEFQSDLEKGAEFWETCLVKTAKRSRFPDVIDPIDLPESSAPGKWSAAHRGLLDQARSEIERHKRIEEKIKRAKSLARRNRYALEVMDQIHKLQLYPSNLLLMLEKYDKATTTKGKNEVGKDILQYVNSGFDKMRADFEKVYSQTRFMKNPDGYKLDQIRHLANGTNNSDWMFIFELAMNRKVSQWLNE